MVPQSLSAFLQQQRPDTDHERILFIPERAQLGDPEDLLHPSVFSHVPIIDYEHYRPVIKDGTLCAMLLQRLKYLAFEFCFWVRTLYHLMHPMDYLYLLFVNLLTAVFCQVSLLVLTFGAKARARGRPAPGVCQVTRCQEERVLRSRARDAPCSHCTPPPPPARLHVPVRRQNARRQPPKS